MPPGEGLPVKPSIVAWARESSGLDVASAARKLAVSEIRVNEWEAGERLPTAPQLRKMAQVYGRPLAWFFLPAPPKEKLPLTDFRTIESREAGLSRELRTLLRRAESQRQAALDLCRLLDEHPRRDWTEVQLESSAEKIGWQIRLLLFGKDGAYPRKPKDENDHLNIWVSAAERCGFLVLQASRIPKRDMRGFSIVFDPFPVIVLNGADKPFPRIFSLAHEIAHVLHRTSGLCDLHEEGPTDIETRCNAAAAAALMPRERFLEHPTVQLSQGKQREWSLDELAGIGRGFGASREAVLRRLLTFKLATQSHYSRYREAFEQRDEEEDSEKGAQQGGPPPGVLQVRNMGRLFSRLAVEAYERRAITLAGLTNYLGIRVEHVDRVREIVRKGEQS